MMWIRWTLPRLRFDQLMRLAWRGLIPVTLTMLLVSSVIVFLGGNHWLVHLIANVVVFTTAAIVAPLVPVGAPVNRRVPLEGSRFNPPEVA